MRILTVVGRLGPGGTARAAHNCALAYAEAGHEAAVLAYEEGGPGREEMEAAGVTVLAPPDADPVGAAGEWGPQVVHLHRPGLADRRTAAILRRLKAAGERRVPVVETNHFGRVDDSADRLLIDAHLHLSRWCLWKWRKWSRHLRPRPLGVVVPHIVRSDVFHPPAPEAAAAFRGRHGVPGGALVMGRVGQPSAGKWSAHTFETFARVARDRPDAWLLLVGMPAAFDGSIEAMPPEARRRVVRIGFLNSDESLRDCYGAMDVFLHSATIGESFGMVLAESMLCGCPVVTLSTPLRDNSQLEVVGHERGGLVAADGAAMVEAVRRLAADADLHRRLGEQGRFWCLQQYSPQRVGDLMERVVHLAASSDSAERLAAGLARDPQLQTEVGDDEITALLSKMIGRTPRRTRLLMRLLHAPRVHRAWRRLRKRR